MKIKETRMLGVNKVYTYCVQNNYYTSGCNEEYDNMFKLFMNKEITPELLYKVAKDICCHTEELGNRLEMIQSVMTDLASFCYSTFVIEE